MRNKLTMLEAISVVSIITISQIILDFPEYLIDITGTGTIANILFLSIISMFFCVIISKIFKNFSSQDIIDISEYVGGKFLKFVISSIFIIFLFLTIILALSNFLFLIKAVYFPSSNPLFIFSIFTIAILVASRKGFASLKNIILTFFGILIFSIVALLFGDNGNFSSNNIIPFFGYDYKTTFQTGISNIFIFNFIIMYFFLMPLLSKKNDYSKIVFSSFIINLILLSISIISILFYYPTSLTHNLTTLNSLNTLFLVTRRIHISSFLSQTDSIFVSIWGFAILGYITLLVNAILYILNKLFSYEDEHKLSFPIISIIIGGTVFLDRVIQVQYLEKYVFKYFSIILTFGISFIILLLGFLKIKKRGSKNAKTKK